MSTNQYTGDTFLEKELDQILDKVQKKYVQKMNITRHNKFAFFIKLLLISVTIFTTPGVMPQEVFAQGADAKGPVVAVQVSESAQSMERVPAGMSTTTSSALPDPSWNKNVHYQTPTACVDPTTCEIVSTIQAFWRCNIPGCSGTDWVGSVISWPSWSAYSNNARTGNNSRTVYSSDDELLYPYMGSWANGCQVTAVSGTILIVEWERGANVWRETFLSPGQSHTIALVAPENGALIEALPAGSSVTLENCNPQSIIEGSPTPTAPSVITIGETNILGTDDSGYANLLAAQQAILSQSATIQSLSFYVTSASGQLRLGIYDDVGGNPGTLLAQTAAFTPIVGWNTQNVLSPTLLSPGTYWLAFLPQSGNLHFRLAFNGSARGQSYTFGTLPNTFSSMFGAGQFHWSLYATLLISSTSTNTPTYTPLPTNTSNLTVTATNTLLPSNTPTMTHTPTFSPTPSSSGSDTLYLSFADSGTTGGISFADEDILAYDQASGSWSLYFDGSDVGLSGTDVNAFALMSDGSILLSVDMALSIGSLGTVDDSDIVRFIPTSLGTNTAGTFAWYFDGSDVGLTTNGEDIDAIGFAPDGRLVISTTDNITVAEGSAVDEDLLAFSATSLGSTTIGTWSLYFDGSDVGLAESANEDVNGLWIDGSNGKLYLSTLGAFSAAGVSGDGADIFICTLNSSGANTSCAYDSNLYWDASDNGFAGQGVDGIDVLLSAGGATPTPMATLVPISTNTPTNIGTSTPISTPVPSTSTPTLTLTPSDPPAFTPTITVTSTHTPTNTPAPTASVITIGETNILTTEDNGNANLLVAQQAVLSQSATLQSLSFYVATAGGQLRLGIYSDSGGNPGTLLAQTAAFTPTVGLNTQNVQTPVLLPAGSYWLAYLPQSSSLHYRIGFTGSARGSSYTFGSMPGAYPSSPLTGDFHWSFYATLTR